MAVDYLMSDVRYYGDTVYIALLRNSSRRVVAFFCSSMCAEAEGSFDESLCYVTCERMSVLCNHCILIRCRRRMCMNDLEI